VSVVGCQWGRHPPREPSRRVRYDQVSRAHAYTNQTAPCGTALLGDAAPGTSCQAKSASSLQDKSHSAIEGPRIELALMGFQPPSERALKLKARCGLGRVPGL
jgi:hypothetical protein